MGFFSRSVLWTPRRREPSPESDPPDHMTDDGVADFRHLRLDDGDGNRRSDPSRARVLGYTGAGSFDTTSRRTDQYSSKVVTHQGSHGRRPQLAGTPGHTSKTNSHRPRPLDRHMFWDTPRPPGSEWMTSREEIAGNNNVTPSSSESDSGSESAPRFRDVDVEFDHNQVQDIRGGARAVTGMRAGRDLKARIHHNSFGR